MKEREKFILFFWGGGGGGVKVLFIKEMVLNFFSQISDYKRRELFLPDYTEILF